jgi:hypothetical protein
MDNSTISLRSYIMHCYTYQRSNRNNKASRGTGIHGPANQQQQGGGSESGGGASGAAATANNKQQQLQTRCSGARSTSVSITNALSLTNALSRTLSNSHECSLSH